MTKFFQRSIIHALTLCTLLTLLTLATGCAGGPPTTVTVNANGDGSYTGGVSTDLQFTNAAGEVMPVTIGGTMTGNPDTGQVSGGVVITFNKEPDAGVMLALVECGASPTSSSKVWYFSKWDYKDQKQAAVLQSALRSGAVLSRPQVVKSLRGDLQPIIPGRSYTVCITPGLGCWYRVPANKVDRIRRILLGTY